MSVPNAPAPSATLREFELMMKTDVKEKMAVVYITVNLSVNYTTENGQERYKNAVVKLAKALADGVNQKVGYRVEGTAQMTCTQLKDGSDDPCNDHVWLFCMTQTMVPC